MPREKNKPEPKSSGKTTKRGRYHGPKNHDGPTRKERQRDHRLHAAEVRRESQEFIVPMNAMVELASLPPKARDKIVKALPEEIHVNKDYTTGPEDSKEPIMVPHPRRGMNLKGKQLSDALARRADQTVKIDAKRKTRNRLASMTPAQRYERRSAGMEHRRPRHRT